MVLRCLYASSQDVCQIGIRLWSVNMSSLQIRGFSTLLCTPTTSIWLNAGGLGWLEIAAHQLSDLDGLLRLNSYPPWENRSNPSGSTTARWCWDWAFGPLGVLHMGFLPVTGSRLDRFHRMLGYFLSPVWNGSAGWNLPPERRCLGPDRFPRPFAIDRFHFEAMFLLLG